MNKRQQQIYQRYLCSEDVYLWQIYGRFSTAKQLAYENCAEKYNKLNGYRFRIISHNSNVFTIGFLYYDSNDKRHFHYETAQKQEEWSVD